MAERLDPALLGLAVAAIGAPLLKQEYGSYSCIHGAAIAVKVAEHYGVLAQVLVARLSVFNAAYETMMRECGGLPTVSNSAELHARYPDAWAVGVGFGKEGSTDGKWETSEPNRLWPGHLVAIYGPHKRKNSTLVDLAAKQADRPHIGIVIPPVAVEVEPPFLSGERNVAGGRLIGAKGSIVLRYESFPRERTYEVTPAWKDHTFIRRVVRMIILQIEASVEK